MGWRGVFFLFSMATETRCVLYGDAGMITMAGVLNVGVLTGRVLTVGLMPVVTGGGLLLPATGVPGGFLVTGIRRTNAGVLLNFVAVD